MKISLVLDGWQILHYETGQIGPLPVSEDFNSGRRFSATIELNTEQEYELLEALRAGNRPVFLIAEPDQ